MKIRYIFISVVIFASFVTAAAPLAKTETSQKSEVPQTETKENRKKLHRKVSAAKAAAEKKTSKASGQKEDH